MLILNKGQATAVKELKKWWFNRNKQLFKISGPAGTGKTTIIYRLIEEIDLLPENVLFVSYVGKAVLVMMMNGNRNASTIHSAIYDVTIDVVKGSGGLLVRKPIFTLKDTLHPNIKLIVVDEAGMVAPTIKDDLLSFGIPIVALGDLDQLPPIFGKSVFLDNPDVVLTQPMRQAEDSPILYLGELARLGKRIPVGKYGSCHVIEYDDMMDEMMRNADIMICGKNITRGNLNRYYRENILGFDSDLPVIGDKIICRKNNWTEYIDGIPLLNGMVGFVENHPDTSNYRKGYINIDFRPEFMAEDYFYDIPFDVQFFYSQFDENRLISQFDNGDRFEFGNAITAHLAQGSQYDNTLVLEEQFGSNTFHRRWLYTAISRAKEGMVLVKPKTNRRRFQRSEVA